MSILSRVLDRIPQATQELDLLPQIEEFANSHDWEGAQRVLTENPALLGDLAHALMLELAAAARQQGNEAVALTLEDHLSFLATVRDQGIEQAFGEATERDGAGAPSPEDYTDVPPELADDLQHALAALAAFGVAQQAEDLAEAATLWRALVEHPRFAAGTPGFRLAVSKSAALVLAHCYARTGNLDDLKEAIALWRGAVELGGEDAANRVACLTYLGHALQARADAQPSTARFDLDAAVAAYRECWQQSIGRGKATAAANLAGGLHARYRLASRSTDLDEAIELYATARRDLPLYARTSAEVLSGQGGCLFARYQLHGDPHDLDAAINALRLAAQRTPPDSPQLPDRLHRLARALTARYDLSHDAGSLDEAIASLQAAIQLATNDRAGLHVYAVALGECMRRFYASAGLEL